MSAKFSQLDTLGTIGGIFSAFAAAAPCCLPLLAAAGASLGLGFLGPYRSVSEWVFQGFAFLALFGVILSYRRHKKLLPLFVMVAAVAAIFAYYYLLREASLVYGGLAGLLLASVLNHRAAKQCKICEPGRTKAVILKS
ncbi:MAG: MerC domain-containing protein, partial [Methylococcales bacterium]